ncbi:MAG: sigma-70 family RNA polymerase sigma factor [Planctomycetes bacterium]|nr:sigma-70 family RNA polymerase sigma factor [Planctomycetota bacterium]
MTGNNCCRRAHDVADSLLVVGTPALLSIPAFEELMSRVQAGDPAAAAELVRYYEPDIRLEVRVRLRIQDGRVRRMLDTMDITQSVLASFFAGVAVGRFAPQNPQQLVGLLVTMARNKLLSQVRHQRQQQRDARRSEAFDGAVHDVAADHDSPSQIVASRELLGEFRKRLSVEERQLSDRRGAGEPWTAIATELGGTPEGRRKQLERAFARILKEMDLDEELVDAPPAARED